ncbi:glycoside hydrolase family 3 N-terminal domain-containing protein [Microbacterium jiangjiandongii]|uniref:glycoside hydrolase family 3 N-terminal domain-containing protein n=1 Tax=Microbacterium jiangjiandongii TaxID=3049071 RepID=UPI00214BA40D|nr:glycoside hydrolase family 3 N-terminal domain-containing protein [Microbacterium sp. zg.Y843]MCR2815379.1 glycoside hydrolase family 3 protein [Microbacterium sp. zg.Y843]
MRDIDLIPGVLLPGFAGRAVPEWLRAELHHGLAGVCLFAGNIDPDDPAGTARLAERLRGERAGVLIAADEEGGAVTRLESVTGSTLPSPAQLGLVPADVAERAGSVLGARVRRAGMNVVLAPVADVNDNPANPVIGPRSFGADPHQVAARVAAQVAGIQTAGVAACPKHWPGHGDTDVDSHRGLPTVSEATASRHAPPFVAAIEAGARVIMTAHLVVPEWGDLPVTVNPAAIARLRALGFDGVVVTDAVEMAAIAAAYGAGGGAVRALAAGADLICIGNPEHAGVDDEAQYREVADAVARALADGSLEAARLREAHDRVSRFAAHVASDRRPDAAEPGGPTLAASDAGLIDAAWRARAESGAVAALRDLGDVVDARDHATQAVASRAVPVVDLLRGLCRPGSAVTAVVTDRATPAQRAAVAAAAARGQTIVVHVGALPAAWDAPTVAVGADSAFSAAMLRRWIEGGE